MVLTILCFVGSSYWEIGNESFGGKDGWFRSNLQMLVW